MGQGLEKRRRCVYVCGGRTVDGENTNAWMWKCLGTGKLRRSAEVEGS